MANLTSQDDYIRTALRLPRNLHKDVQESAEKNQRSMNAEIVARLYSSYEQEQGISSNADDFAFVNEYLNWCDSTKHNPGTSFKDYADAYARDMEAENQDNDSTFSFTPIDPNHLSKLYQKFLFEHATHQVPQDIDSLVDKAIDKRLKELLDAPGKSMFSKLINYSNQKKDKK